LGFQRKVKSEIQGRLFGDDGVELIILDFGFLILDCAQNVNKRRFVGIEAGYGLIIFSKLSAEFGSRDLRVLYWVSARSFRPVSAYRRARL